MHYMPDSDAPREDRLPLFAIDDLSFDYPDGTAALRDISLSIYQGDRIALVGRNGSGKTTLVKHLNGLCAARPGTLAYKGQPLAGPLLNELRLNVGVLFQDPDDHLFCNTLYDDVAFGPMNQGLAPEIVEARVIENVNSVNLGHLLYKPAHLLSYGQKKRAAFAAIMAMNPEVLILDEPTANLDPLQEKIFKKLLQDYEGTLIVIDHDLLFLYDLCDRAVVMADGHLHHDYGFNDLVSQPAALREHGLDFTFRFSCCGNHPHQVQPHRHHQKTHDHGREKAHLAANGGTAPFLELQHLSFRYPDGTPGLRDVSLIVRPGDTIALVGENGAGKSTLAACLLGLNKGNGYFFVDGKEINEADRRNLRKRVGMVFQNAADQLFCPSCYDEVTFGPRQMGVHGDKLEERVRKALTMVHLEGFADRVPLNLSGGERKRLAIASVLSMEPEMLILDEPTAGLDPQGEELLMEILDHLSMTRILITHDLFFINALSRRTVVMHDGRIIRDYPTVEFLADEHLQAVNELDYTYKSDCGQRIMEIQQRANPQPPISA